MDLIGFKYQVCDTSRRINEAMNTLLSRMGTAYGLSAMQVRILLEIDPEGTMTVGAIANEVMVAGANVSTMCKKLEQQGFIKRSRDKLDERIVRIGLTELGIKATKDIDQLFDEKILKALGDQPEEKYQSVLEAIKVLNELLGQVIEEKGEIL